MTPICPESQRECLIDPIKLENRLTRMEGKIDLLLESKPESSGMSGKGVAGITAIVSAVVIGAIEGIKTYFTKG